MHQGHLSVLQESGKREEYSVKYNSTYDISNQIPLHRQNPIHEELLGEREAEAYYCKRLLEAEARD
jgi:hypothetical protein